MGYICFKTESSMELSVVLLERCFADGCLFSCLDREEALFEELPLA